LSCIFNHFAQIGLIENISGPDLFSSKLTEKGLVSNAETSEVIIAISEEAA